MSSNRHLCARPNSPVLRQSKISGFSVLLWRFLCRQHFFLDFYQTILNAERRLLYDVFETEKEMGNGYEWARALSTTFTTRENVHGKTNIAVKLLRSLRRSELKNVHDSVSKAKSNKKKNKKNIGGRPSGNVTGVERTHPHPTPDMKNVCRDSTEKLKVVVNNRAKISFVLKKYCVSFFFFLLKIQKTTLYYSVLDV